MVERVVKKVTRLVKEMGGEVERVCTDQDVGMTIVSLNVRHIYCADLNRMLEKHYVHSSTYYHGRQVTFQTYGRKVMVSVWQVGNDPSCVEITVRNTKWDW